MNGEDVTFELVEDYIHGRLNGEDLEAFEAALKNNTELASKVKLHELADDLVIENRLLQIKEILLKEETKTTSSYKIILIGTAIIAALYLAFIWLYPSNEEEDKKTKSTTTFIKKPVENSNKKISIDTHKTYNNSHPLKKESIHISSSTTISEENMISAVEAEPLTDKTNQEPPVDVIEEEIKPSERTILNPCEQVELSAVIKNTETCDNEAKGTIRASEFRGGSSPYTYNVYQGEELKDAAHLLPGTYKLILSDGNGCNKIFDNLVVKKKNCPKDYSFNPFIGENWEIPSNGKSGKLIVYDPSGGIYFEKNIFEDEKSLWSGEGKNGEIKTGYFIFAFEGQNGYLIQGSVTIVK